MSFQDIPPVDIADDFLDVAFRRAKQKASKVRGTKSRKTKIAKSKEIELARINAVKSAIVSKFQKILDTFPKTNELTDFYNELIECTVDFIHYKKSLGSVAWGIKQIQTLHNAYKIKITKTGEIEFINKHRREFYGRISSVLKQIKKNLLYLQECRKIMRGYPTVKSGLETFAIAGFPNVGKTTLLFKITGSKPEIAPYAFTTKGINIAYKTKDDKKIQFLDTPGTLNRFEKMNNIEKQAHLAIKLIADKLIYVFDPTEPYPMESQIQLFKNLQEFNKPILIYISKLDIKDEEIQKKVLELKKKFKKENPITDVKKLIERIL